MKRKISLILSTLIFTVVTVISVNVFAYTTTQQSSTSFINQSTCVDISNNQLLSVTLEYSSVDYTGTPLTPAVTVMYNSSLLNPNIDYTVSYSNNVNAGTANVVVTGKGNYSGTVARDFTIKRLNIAQKGKASVSFDNSKVIYSGQNAAPTVYVSYNKSAELGAQYLAENVDFTVSYTDNDEIGIATATVTGIGNYTGTRSKRFKILPPTVTNVYVSNVSSSSLVLNWDRSDAVSGYDIAVFDEKSGKSKHKVFVSSKYSSYNFTGLTSNKSYKYKVRAYKNIDGKKFYGEYSAEVGTAIKPKKVVVNGVTKSKNRLNVVWNKVDCSGYQVFYSTDKRLKRNVKSVFVSSSNNSVTIKKINKSKRYYVKVRAYSNNNNNILFGEKSAVVSSYFSNLYAEYSSYYVNNAKRTINLKIASKAISETIVNPGETFSLNDVVGPRTAAKGYKEAPVFTGGNSVEDGLGGGICQVASTLFNTALKANVTISERHQHSQRVSYVPLGRDAAIYGNAVDFKWTNNTKYAIKIKMSVKNGVISCKFYTCEKAKPKRVKLNVSQKSKKFTLKRSVSGKINYTAYSTY